MEEPNPRRWLNKKIIIAQIKTDIRANNRSGLICVPRVGFVCRGAVQQVRADLIGEDPENDLFHSRCPNAASPRAGRPLRRRGRFPATVIALYMKSNGGTWRPSPPDKGPTEVQTLVLSSVCSRILIKHAKLMRNKS